MSRDHLPDRLGLQVREAGNPWGVAAAHVARMGAAAGAPFTDRGGAMTALTAVDRCDRCGAQAYLRVELVAGELLFCAHHAREHRAKLLETATTVSDETHLLGTP